MVAKGEEVEHLPIRDSVYVERLRCIFSGWLPGSMDSDSLTTCNGGRLRSRRFQNGCSLTQNGIVDEHLEHVLLRFVRESGAGHAVLSGKPLDEERGDFAAIDSC